MRVSLASFFSPLTDWLTGGYIEVRKTGPRGRSSLPHQPIIHRSTSISRSLSLSLYRRPNTERFDIYLYILAATAEPDWLWWTRCSWSGFFFSFPPYFHFITSHYFVLGASRPVLRPALTWPVKPSSQLFDDFSSFLWYFRSIQNKPIEGWTVPSTVDDLSSSLFLSLSLSNSVQENMGDGRDVVEVLVASHVGTFFFWNAWIKLMNFFLD